MFIAIVGTRGAGKSTVEDYLVSKGFTSVHLAREDLVEVSPACLSATSQQIGVASTYRLPHLLGLIGRMHISLEHWAYLGS